MKSIFDSFIDLNDNEAVLTIYCKNNHDVKEQHAILLVEVFHNGNHELRSYDFYPKDKHCNNNEFNNHLRSNDDKVRKGEVRERVADLTNITRKELFEKLHIHDGLFTSNYRTSSCTFIQAKGLLELTKAEMKSPPYFNYSGNQREDDQVEVYNCITWIKHILKNSKIKIQENVLTYLVEHSTGTAVETSMDLNIPKYHTDTTKCRVM